MAYLGKEFTLASQENMEGFLTALKVPEEFQKKIINSKSVAKLEKSGDKYTYTFTSYSSPGGLKTITFTPGVEFEQELLGNIKTKNVVEVNGDKSTHTMKSEDGKWVKFQREYSDNEVVVTITASDFDGVAKRIYKA